MSETERTQPITMPPPVVEGYWLTVGVSDETADVIAELQQDLTERFSGAIWTPPRDALHISLLAWVDPLHDYGQPNKQVFEKIKDTYTAIFEDIIQDQPPITVSFDHIEVHPAAIIIRGRDNGSFQRIRDEFVARAGIVSGTKQPPTIVHSTIAKFSLAIDIDKVRAFMNDTSIHQVETVTGFNLTREDQLFMVKYNVLKQFALRGE